LATTAKPVGVQPDGVDGHYPDERDLQVAADTVRQEIGDSQINVDLSHGQRRALTYQRLANPFRWPRIP
jgi:hypothetical protein